MSRHDAGMLAVARVRAVREQDSRIGLQKALHEQRAEEANAAELRERLENAAGFTSGTPGSYLTLRASLDAIGAALRSTEADVAACRTVSEAAHARWQHDKTQLSAVETLLERRAAARRADAVRREARAADEAAVLQWRRRTDEVDG